MQTDIIVNVKDSHNDNPIVPDTNGSASDTNTNSPNTGFLTVDDNSTYSGNANINLFFLSGILSVTVLIATIIFLIIKRIVTSKKPRAARRSAAKKESFLTTFSQHLPRNIIILAIITTSLSFAGLSYSHFLYDTAVIAEEDNNSENTLSITASSTSKIDITLEDNPVFAYFKDTITVASSTEAGYTLTANIVGNAKDLINTTNEAASEAKISGLDSTSAQPLANNTWGLALTEPTSKDDAVFYGVPTDGNTPFTIVNKDTATPENDTTDIYYGAYVTPDLPTGTYSGITIEYMATANVLPTNTMQGFDSQACAALATDETITLTDIRDNKEYTVAKLRDGNCWMTQNLALGSSTAITLTPANTNITSNFTLPASISDGNWTGIHETPEIFDYAGTHPSEQASNKYGNLYNWIAATAGSGASATASGDAEYSICPKNWRLPSVGTASTTDNEFYIMLNNYITDGTWSRFGWFDVPTSDFVNAPVSLVFSGTYTEDNLFDQGLAGYWWSSTSIITTYAYSLEAFDTGFIGPHSNTHGKGNGLAIRCLIPST